MFGKNDEDEGLEKLEDEKDYLLKIEEKMNSQIPRITRKELAKRIGVSPSEISNLFNRKRFMKVDTLIKIAKALNCNVTEFFEINPIVEETNVFEETLKKLIKMILTEEKVLNKRE